MKIILNRLKLLLVVHLKRKYFKVTSKSIKPTQREKIVGRNLWHF